MRSDILGFGEIGRARVLRGVQIARRDREAMRCAGVRMPGVSVRARWEDACKRIHPGARADSGLAIV